MVQYALVGWFLVGLVVCRPPVNGGAEEGGESDQQALPEGVHEHPGPLYTSWLWGSNQHAHPSQEAQEAGAHPSREAQEEEEGGYRASPRHQPVNNNKAPATVDPMPGMLRPVLDHVGTEQNFPGGGGAEQGDQDYRPSPRHPTIQSGQSAEQVNTYQRNDDTGFWRNRLSERNREREENEYLRPIGRPALPNKKPEAKPAPAPKKPAPQPKPTQAPPTRKPEKYQPPQPKPTRKPEPLPEAEKPYEPIPVAEKLQAVLPETEKPNEPSPAAEKPAKLSTPEPMPVDVQPVDQRSETAYSEPRATLSEGDASTETGGEDGFSFEATPAEPAAAAPEGTESAAKAALDTGSDDAAAADDTDGSATSEVTAAKSSEPKSQDLVKVPRPVDMCVKYQNQIQDTVTFLDNHDKESYLRLRSEVDDKTMFDFCTEVLFIMDEVEPAGDVPSDKRIGKFFDFDLGKLFDDLKDWVDGHKNKDKKNREDPFDEDNWFGDWKDDSFCRPREFCRKCSRRGPCCRRYCERMWFTRDHESYSCSPRYCNKNKSNDICRKCRHCYCNELTFN